MAQDKKTYGSLYQQHYLEQYKLYVNGVEKISDRRESANKYFVTINSALLVVSGFVVQYTHSKQHMLLSGLALLGVIVCVIFGFLINSYKQLNTAKFKMLHEIEVSLPIELYKKEWDVLGNGKNRRKYYPFSHIERLIPVIFAVAYIAILVIVGFWR